MCGGSIEFLPCSHVGHIFRPGHPYNMTGEKGKLDVNGWNTQRLAEVWMDEYKRIFYIIRPDLIGKDCGDLSSRKEIRKKLNCRSFKWFLENIYPEKFVPDEKVYAYGEIKNAKIQPGLSKYCLDTLGKKNSVGIFPCQNGGGNQFFSFSRENELRNENFCLLANSLSFNIEMKPCSGGNNEKWSHVKFGYIKHSSTDLCLDFTDLKSGKPAIVNKCKLDKPGQLFEFKFYRT